MQVEEKIKQIQNMIEESQKPFMFYDTDTDGLTSYLQIKKAFSKLRGLPLEKDAKSQIELCERMPQNTDLILIFDIAFLTIEFLETIKEYRVIWVDHHPTNDKDLIDKYGILHFNPLDFDKKDNRPVSYWSYLISGKMDISLGVIGSVCDFFLLDIIKKFHDTNKESFDIIFNICEEKKKELFDFIEKTKFNDEKSKKEIELWIQYLIYDAGLIKLKNFFDFIFKLNDEKIATIISQIEKMSIKDIKILLNSRKEPIFEEILDLWDKYKQIYLKASKKRCLSGDFLLFEYRGKDGFTKTLCEQLCYENKEKKVIAVCFKKKGKDAWSCSFRGNGYVVNSLVEKSLLGLDGRGGGHPYAAGMRVADKDFETFKSQVYKNFI